MKAKKCVKCGKAFQAEFVPALGGYPSVCNDCSRQNVTSWLHVSEGQISRPTRN
jgi:hypothetical protein